MTIEELERGQKVLKEIDDLRSIVRCLAYSIEKHEARERTKNLSGYRRILRFMNTAKKQNNPPEACIFMFDGMGHGHIDIPVDPETVNTLLQLFTERLEAKEKEFAEIAKQ